MKKWETVVKNRKIAAEKKNDVRCRETTLRVLIKRSCWGPDAFAIYAHKFCPINLMSLDQFNLFQLFEVLSLFLLCIYIHLPTYLHTYMHMRERKGDGAVANATEEHIPRVSQWLSLYNVLSSVSLTQ
jgi:hypothetical protein